MKMYEKAILCIRAISDAVNIKTKIMIVVLTTIGLLSLGVLIQIQKTLNISMGQQLERQGISIARDVSARSVDYVFTNNLYALHELVNDTKANNVDVRYVFIMDQHGEVLVHTFTQGIPKGLRQANIVQGKERYKKVIFDTDEGRIYDFAVPIFEGRGGTARVGITERTLINTLNGTRNNLILSAVFVSLIGAGAALILTLVLTAPIEELVEVTKAVGAGNLDIKVKVWWAKDEIGQLGLALNNMIGNLKKSKDKVDLFSEQLIRRNKELAFFNDVATTIGQSLELKIILNSVLKHVTEILHTVYTEINVIDKEEEKIILKVTNKDVLLEQEFIEEKQHKEIINNILTKAKVLTTELEINSSSGNEKYRVVSLPLKSKFKVVGIMNLIWAIDDVQNKKSMQLLSTLSSQIGVAIENALLWQELKTKENIRKMLLEKVISAQEEERKRIARELHDQTSQSVASLMLGLNMIENTNNLDDIKGRVDELRKITYTVLGDLHDLALELRPSVLDDLGLEAALQGYIKEWSVKFGIQVDIHFNGLVNTRLPGQIELTLYRVIQEALTNVAKYAEASTVSIIVERRNHIIIAIIEDNGVGFNVENVLQSPLEQKKLGLFGMEERVLLNGGEFSIESEIGIGTTIYVKIPLDGVEKYGQNKSDNS